MPQPASLADLRRMPYFRRLSDDEAERFAKVLSVRVYGPRECLLITGDESPGFFLMRAGKARILRTGPEGREQTLRLLAPGDTFAEVPVLDGGPSPSTVEAIERCEVVLVPAARFRELVAAHPEIALDVLQQFARRLRAFTEMVGQMSMQTVQARLARYLYQTAREEGVPTAEGIVVPRELSLQDLASLVGSVREVVSRSMRTLEQDGVVEVRRTEILVRDLEALAELV